MTTTTDLSADAAPATTAAPNWALFSLLAAVVAFIFAGWFAVVAWPFMIAAVFFAVRAFRAGQKKAMPIIAIVLTVLAIIGSWLMPALVLLVGLAMFGEAADVSAFGEVLWHYWSGAHLFGGSL